MYTILHFLSGVVLLWTGIFAMRYGLTSLFWSRMRLVLHKLTVTPLRGLLFGTVAAALMQSSTAVSLITIGFVSADYMSFYQSLGIILGANIGTCSTVQFLTLPFPEEFLLPCFFIASLVCIVSPKSRSVGIAIAGIAAMFGGLKVLAGVFKDADSAALLLHYLSYAKDNVLYGILGGIIMTFLFQSSSAATAVIMLLAQEGVVSITTAAFIVYGNNIGSCLPSLFVGAAAPLAAKRVAVAHFALNLLGVLLFLPCTHFLITIATYLSSSFDSQVAMLHTLFNIISSLAVLPVLRQFAKLVIILTPGRTKR